MKANLRIKYSFIFCLTLCTFFISLFVAPGLGLSVSSEEVKEQIQKKKKQIDEQKEDLSRLSEKERRLCKEIDQIEQRVSRLEKEYSKQRSLYKNSQEEVKGLQQEAQDIEKVIKEKKQAIRILLDKLWRIYLRKTKLQLGSFSSWPELDLNLSWLSSLYTMLDKRIKALSQIREELEKNLVQQENIQENMQSQLNKLQSTKDQLLQEKLVYLDKINKLRTKRVVMEEQLAKIQETIKDLKYKLTIQQTHQFEKIKGYLPWPVKGKILFDYDLKAEPPREGIGFALQEQNPVRSISWGKVVYNDKLRGFGRVVIIYHGSQYYSLYAFLSESEVEIGRDVEKGETLGRAGYYPKSQGPGMYFELRCGQQPVDPGPWLRQDG